MILRNLKRQLLFSVFFLLAVCLPGNNLYAITPVQKTVLSNGLVILYIENHSLPFVTIQLLIDGGSRNDPPGEEGLANLAARGLLLGTSGHTIAALNEELDFLGAALNASSGRDFSTVSLRVLTKDLDKGISLFMEVLTQPTFPDAEIKREKEKALAEIQSEEDQPEAVAEKEFQKALFLTSPYGHPVIGTKESVPKITRDAVVNFYRSYYRPNNYILAVVGDMTSDELKNKLLPRLNALPSTEMPEAPFKPLFAKGPETVRINRQITQANIILGNEGISRGDPDFYAVSVMNYILGGGGFASRLLEEIRNKRGLAYSVASFFDAAKYPGSFQIVLQTKNLSAREAISLAVKQTELIQKEPVSDKELEGAKKYLIGSFPLRLDTQGKLANFFLQVQYYGLGLDYPEKYPSLIKSVTKEDVLRVAKKYLHPDKYILVVVANLKEAGMNADDPVMEAPGGSSVAQKNLGITVENITSGLQKEFKIKDESGVAVIHVRPDSPADAGGIQAGDVIKEFDRKPIRNMKDFESALKVWEGERVIEFKIKRGENTLYIVIGTDRNKI